jgi:hypothetical protein
MYVQDENGNIQEFKGLGKEIIDRKLTIYLNDNMIEFAKEKGFKMPCVSIRQHYGKEAVFTIEYKDNVPKNYELRVLGKNGLAEAIYLMN